MVTMGVFHANKVQAKCPTKVQAKPASAR
jgi:hypothetical protein